jgi:hypothetical protein
MSSRTPSWIPLLYKTSKHKLLHKSQCVERHIIFKMQRRKKKKTMKKKKIAKKIETAIFIKN